MIPTEKRHVCTSKYTGRQKKLIVLLYLLKTDALPEKTITDCHFTAASGTTILHDFTAASGTTILHDFTAASGTTILHDFTAASGTKILHDFTAASGTTILHDFTAVSNAKRAR